MAGAQIPRLGQGNPDLNPLRKYGNHRTMGDQQAQHHLYGGRCRIQDQVERTTAFFTSVK